MRACIFSDRCDDAEAEAGRIADRLHASFGKDEVFFNTVAIDGGDRWMRHIEGALAEAQVKLVVIERPSLPLPGDFFMVTHRAAYETLLDCGFSAVLQRADVADIGSMSHHCTGSGPL